MDTNTRRERKGFRFVEIPAEMEQHIARNQAANARGWF